MLGLGISKSAQGVKSGIVKLLNSLKRRAEYFENKKDSKSEIKVLKDYELLDKATILLTPTATSDARVHSVKTYTGELVTNGTFDTDSDWTKGTGITIGGGVATFTSTPSGQSVGQNAVASSLPNGAYAKVTFEVLSRTEGSFGLYFSGTLVGSRSSVGVFTAYFTKGTETSFYIRALGTTSGTISNVSVVDVSSDFAFDRASSATRINSDGLVQDMQSITDPELVLNGDFEKIGDEVVINGDFSTSGTVGNNTWTLGFRTSDGGISIADGILDLVNEDNSDFDGRVQFSNGVDAGLTIENSKSYLFEYEITENPNNSNFFLYKGGSYVSITKTVGRHKYYFKSNGTQVYIRNGGNNSTIKLSSVSLKKLDPNNRWNIGTAWAIENGVATASDTGFLIQSNATTGTSGETYKLTYTISNSNDGSLTLQGGSNPFGTQTIPSTNGTHTLNLTTANTTRNLQFYANSFRGSIDNVSLKNTTFSDDVDLARINYDSNGENGHILLEPTSTNLVTYSEDIDSLDDGDGEVAVNSTLTYESDVVAPDGSLGVYRIQNPATASTYLKVTNNTTAAQSMSVWVKAKTVGTNNQFTLYRDGTGGSASDVETATGEWQRFEYSWSTVGSGAYFINNDGDTYASDLYVWGIQVENLPYTTSYIPNHTSGTVTRAADTMPYDASPIKTPTDSQAVLYLEIATNEATNRTFGGFVQSNGNAMYGLYHWASTDNNKFGFNTWNNDCYGFTDADFLLDGNFHKIAALFDFTDFTKNKLFIDGVQYSLSQVRGTTIQKSASALALDAPSADQRPIASYKTVALFDEALTDDELELLTGVTNYGSFSELASANGYTII